MKVRRVTIFSGEQFDVPQGIQRIDHRATHGWQLRYGGTKLYSDRSNDGSGAAASLQLATKELLKRIAALPAPSLLQRGPSTNKRSGLPPGITGPVVRTRPNSSTRDCSLMVLIPRFGDPKDLFGLIHPLAGAVAEPQPMVAVQREPELA